MGGEEEEIEGVEARRGKEDGGDGTEEVRNQVRGSRLPGGV